MIGTIRKHSTWLWVVIIAATIITFVFWGSQTSRVDNARTGRPNFGSINGERISQEDFFDAQREVMLRYFFNYGNWPDQNAQRMGFDLERETYFRLLLIQKEKELGIHVSSEAVASTAADILRSINRGNAVPMDVFVKQVLNRQGLTAMDFERFVRHDLGIQQLMLAAGLSGRLVTPQEGRLRYEREHQELSTDVVFFSASNYLAGVTVSPEAVSQFFTNQMARYRLPERVQVKYVEFAASNYLAEATDQLAQVTNLNERIEAKYQELGTNYFRDAKSPEEAKEKIRELMLKGQALTAANKAAGEFAQKAFDLEPLSPDNLAKLAGSNDLTMHISKPFDRDYGPQDLAVRSDFTKRAYALTADEPLAGPVVGEEAVYVMAMDKKLPSEIPPFDTIHEQVTADFKFSQAVQAAVNAGHAFATTLTNELASGKTFSAVCVAAHVQPVSLPPISLSTRTNATVEEHVSLDTFKQVAFSTPPGRSSSFIPTSEGGFLVFVREVLPLELAKMTAALPAFMNSLRLARQNEAFMMWINKEAEKGLRDTPVFRPRQPQMTGAPQQ